MEIKSWKTYKLGDLCKQDKLIVDPFSQEAKKLPYLSLEHIESETGKISKNDIESIDETVKSNTFLFDSRHVLYGKLRPYLNKVALPDFKGRCTTELIPLLPTEYILREFLAWILRKPQTIDLAMREKTGARMPRANMKSLFEMQVKIPSIKEQKELAKKISAKMKLIEENKQIHFEQIKLLDTLIKQTLREFPHF